MHLALSEISFNRCVDSNTANKQGVPYHSLHVLKMVFYRCVSTSQDKIVYCSFLKFVYGRVNIAVTIFVYFDIYFQAIVHF